MHLVIYTQRRERPVIFKFHFIVQLVLVLIVISLLGLPIYFWFENRALRVSVFALNDQKELVSSNILGAETKITVLEEKIRRVNEDPTRPEVLFEVLSSSFAREPMDTIVIESSRQEAAKD